MADFSSSTHCHNWILSREAVTEKCQAANERACQALKKYGATRVDVLPDGSLAYPGAVTAAGGENGPGGLPIPIPLSVEEESLVLRFYEEKIQQVCAAFSFLNKIQATAILYFKRFYLNWSVMEHDPKHIMLTCIYLACKVEESHVSAEVLGRAIQQDPQVVLKNEMTVLQGLDFELIVYSPYRALDGYVCDLANFDKRLGAGAVAGAGAGGGGAAVSGGVEDLRNAARFKVDAMMLTDAPLLFPPGQLAMAALRHANREERKVDLERYMKGLSQSQSLPVKRSYSELTYVLDKIDVAVTGLTKTVEAEVKRIDWKLKICRNPGLQDESKKRERKVKHKQKRGGGQGQGHGQGQGQDVADMVVGGGSHGVKRKHAESNAVM